jgi:hypothetical protein
MIPAMRALPVLALLLPLPALAEQPLSGQEFEALVEGRTLTYGQAGQAPYGVEHYHPDRRVTWAWAADDACSAGTWYEEEREGLPALCFLYEHDPETPRCWRVFRDGDGLRATFLDGGDASVPYEIVDEPGGLVCGGAGV